MDKEAAATAIQNTVFWTPQLLWIALILVLITLFTILPATSNRRFLWLLLCLPYLMLLLALVLLVRANQSVSHYAHDTFAEILHRSFFKEMAAPTRWAIRLLPVYNLLLFIVVLVRKK